MEIRAEKQSNPVADEVSALVAVVRPILMGLLLSLKEVVVTDVGGRENVKIRMFPRLRRPGDGDCGICFEYAVHDAMRRDNQMVLERVDYALRNLCNLPGDSLDSILFAVEKTGSEQLIDTAKELVTSDSTLMSGTRGRPVKLQRHIDGIAQAFRRPSARAALPYSISGCIEGGSLCWKDGCRTLGRDNRQNQRRPSRGRPRATCWRGSRQTGDQGQALQG
jgi:hypothetical protein